MAKAQHDARSASGKRREPSPEEQRQRADDSSRADEIVRTVTQARALLWGTEREANDARGLIRRAYQALLGKDPSRTDVRLGVLRRAIEASEKAPYPGSRVFLVDAFLRLELSGVDPKRPLVQRVVELWPSRRGVWAALGELARDIGIEATDASLKAMWNAKPK
jgi:hypothetical protein